MPNTTTPPDIISALFPFEANKHLVNDYAAAGYAIFVYPKEGYIIMEGDTTTIEDAMSVFSGGARAH